MRRSSGRLPGSVLAQSRATNDAAGRHQDGRRTRPTWRINGNGFFVVEPTIGQADGDVDVRGRQLLHPPRRLRRSTRAATSSTAPATTSRACRSTRRRGTFRARCRRCMRISNAFLPAQQTTRVNYQLNLPQLPKNGALQASRRRRAANCSKPQRFHDHRRRHAGDRDRRQRHWHGRDRQHDRRRRRVAHHHRSASTHAVTYQLHQRRAARRGTTIDITDAASDTMSASVLAQIQARSAAGGAHRRHGRA